VLLMDIPSHPELAALLARCEADPGDHATYLVIADWLEEHRHADVAYAFRWCGRRRHQPYFVGPTDVPPGYATGWLWPIESSGQTDPNPIPNELYAYYGSQERKSFWQAMGWLSDRLRRLRDVVAIP
jgi:uncharacterized protein (TIGR02996 family)